MGKPTLDATWDRIMRLKPVDVALTLTQTSHDSALAALFRKSSGEQAERLYSIHHHDPVNALLKVEQWLVEHPLA